MLLAAIASALALQLAGLYLPPLRELLGTRPLTAADLSIALALSVLGYATVRLDRLINPGRPSPPTAEIPTHRRTGGPPRTAKTGRAPTGI